MENEIKQLIQLDKLELEKQVNRDPFLPQRLRRYLQVQRHPAKGLPWRLAWASAIGMAIALLTFIHLQWLPGPATKPAPGQHAVQFSPFPEELQNTIYHSFIKVAQWEK
jgi:hypothetical protein